MSKTIVPTLKKIAEKTKDEAKAISSPTSPKPTDPQPPTYDPTKPLPGAKPQQAVAMLVQQLNELMALHGPATRGAIQGACQAHVGELVRVLEHHGYQFPRGEAAAG
jgi:hypothetical protein